MPRRPQDPALLARLGARLRRLRERAGLTQQRLADLVSVKPSTMSLFETGDLAPTLTTVAAIARALNVRVADVFDFEGDAPTVPAPQDADEASVLDDYRAMSAEHRALARSLIHALARSRVADAGAER